MNHMPSLKKILPKVFITLIVLVAFAGVLAITTTFRKPSTNVSKPAVSAAAGGYDSKFYDLGKLLVADGLSNTIIDLGREMNGTWYEWSEHHAPPSEPDAYILAWR